MGAYLSSPVRDKQTVEGVGKAFSFGAASMQGWRTAQEDAHNCCPKFDENTDTALFAVYDGHGGAEVAQYMAANFPEYLLGSKTYKEGNLEKALEESFLGFDAQLTKPDVVEILKEIAGVKADERDEDDMDETEEARMLFEEADMPVEKVLARFKAQKQAMLDALDAKLAAVEEDSKAKSTNDAKKDASAADTSADKLCNGSSSHHAINDNETAASKDAGHVNGNNATVSANTNGSVSASGDARASSSSKSEDDEVAGSSSSFAVKLAAENGDDDAGVSSLAATNSGAGSSSGSSLTRRLLDNDEEDEETSDSEEDEDEDGEDWRAKMAAEMGAGDDEDEDDDEEDEEEEEEDEEDEDSVISIGGEEPGADSGCTAVVALMRNNQLIVANAGDSRCVLCRGGQALDMSFDHKPESPIEEARITKAGGRITADGRVNGGLNLSRAIGDHSYKKNTSLPLHEQMITALPDLQTATLTDEDEFIVLACDGIWNMMSSQEVVTFVRERLQAGQTSLTQICEDMFEYCLAPNTLGDGTGCDNMTAIIVLLRSPPAASADHADAKCTTTAADTKKRSLDSADEVANDETTSSCKRAKVDADETALAAESISN